MRTFLPYVIIGATSGSVYAITAMGLVLTLKTSGIFNFAHGAVAAGSAYLFFTLWQQWGLPWPIAGILVVLVAAPIFGIFMERLARGLTGVSTAAKVVAMVGLLVAIQGLIAALYGSAARTFPRYLPTKVYDLGEVNVGADQLITIAIALVSAGGLYTFFRFTRMGTAMRAVVDNADLLDLQGTSPARVRTYSWMIGSVYAALSGVLIAPTVGLDVFLLTLLVVQAFGAAAIGAFQNLALTYVGGLVVGIGAALSTKYVVDFPALSGFPPSFPFIALFVILLVLPKGRLVEVGEETQSRTVEERPEVDRRRTGGITAGMVVVLLVVPAFAGTRLPVFSNGIVFALLFASLALLVRISGQVSLCQAAFAAVGATTFSQLAGGAGLPWFVALILAGLITVPVGALVAIPAIRLSGLYLALATFGFTVLMERLVYGTFLMFGGGGTRVAPRPSFAQGDNAYYYVALGVTLAGVALVYVIHSSRLGRLLRAMSDSPTALSTLGCDVNVSRVLVFCVSAFLAGVSGALFSGLFGTVSAVSFGSFLSLLILPILFLAGRNEVTAPFIAALLLNVAPAYFTSSFFTDYQPVMFGVGAIIIALGSNGRSTPIGARLRAATQASSGRAGHSPVRSRLLVSQAGEG